jgi:small subunit ribosomal protein S6e
MVFKINIGTKEGKTFKLESDAEALIGKSLGETIKGEDISENLTGYEFEIKGASDKSGFTALESVDGEGKKRVLLSYEKGMKKRPKYENKKKRTNKKPKGLRLRKTVRGKIISDAIVQINLKPTKEGSKKLSDIFAPKEEAPAEEKTE